MKQMYLAFLLPLALVTSGCVRGPAAFGFGVLAGASIVAATHPVYVERVEVIESPPVFTLAPADPVLVLEPPRFDATAARVSLQQVDLDACQAVGLPSGYVHARATFMNTGGVSKVVVDAPTSLSPEAVACIGDGIAKATVAPFAGSDVSVGVSVLVRSGRG
jgi:hypothetical protein